MLGNEEAVISEQYNDERLDNELSAAPVLVAEPEIESLVTEHHTLPTENRLLLTISDGLLGAILLMAAILLFAQMDALPLNSAEATQALPVYQFIKGQEFTIGSPVYFTLTALLSPFFGQGDIGARIVPAIFGLLIVGLPWLLRRQIGTVGALVAATLLAISPTTNALTHLAGGESIAIFAALLLFVAWINWRESADSRWLFALAIGSALGMASAPLFYSLLLVGIVGLALAHLFSSTREEVADPFDYTNLRVPLIVGGVLLVTLSTLGLAVPSGLGAVANIFGDWLAQFRLGSGWELPLLALLRYETIPLLLGLIGIVGALRTKNAVAKSLLFWLAASLVLTLAQAGTMPNVVTLTLPLFLLVGALAERVFEQVAAHGMWLIAVATFMWGMIALVNFGRFVKNPANIAAPFIAVTLLLVLIFSIGYFLPHLPTALQAFLLGGLALWVYIGWGTAWALTHRTGNDPRELWVSEGVDSDIKLMRETLREASFQLVNSDSELELLTTVDHPALRWYLRDFENVDYVAGIPVGSSVDGIITPINELPTLDGNYANATFDLVKSNFVASEQDVFLNMLRYWFFEQSSAVLQPDQINVWLKLE